MIGNVLSQLYDSLIELNIEFFLQTKYLKNIKILLKKITVISLICKTPQWISLT